MDSIRNAAVWEPRGHSSERRESILRIALIVFCAVAFVGTVQAGIAERQAYTSNPRTRVDAILAEYPAVNAAKKDILAAALISTGRDGILEVCRRLAGPGKADDASARFAVDSLSLWAARPGGLEKDRLLLVKTLFEALERTPDPDVKDFVISEIQIAGRSEAVRPLSRLLSDRRLGGPAIRALLSIRTAEAEKVLLKSLGASPAPNRTPLVIALGELRSRPAVKKIAAFAESPDHALREAALRALAEIGDPSSEEALKRIPVASSANERYAAAERYMLFARRRAEAGDQSRSAAIARDVLLKYDAPGESQIRSQALTLLAQTAGGDVTGDLLAAVLSSDRRFRMHALDIAQAFAGPEITRRWLARLGEVPSDARTDIIGMLGRRGDQTALPALKELIASPEKPIRLAAMEASARLGGSSVLPELVSVLRTADTDESGAIKRILLGSPAEGAISFAATTFPEASPPARKAMIEVFAAREARNQADLVLKEASGENPDVRTAALAALESVARETDLPRLLDLLVAAPSSSEARPLQNAVAAAANRIADAEKRADSVLMALGKAAAARKPDLIKPLARVGGSRALLAVVEYSKNPDPLIQTAAVSTLAAWKDESAAAPLLSIVREAADRKYAYLALQGYVRLINGSGKPAEERLALLMEALGLARDSAEKRVVVGGFGAIRCIDSFKAAAAWLDDPEIRAKAAGAAFRVAAPIPGDPGLRGIETARTLKRAAPFIESDWNRGLAEDYAEEILTDEGFGRLFNGEDLTGWQGLVEDPVKRAKMTPAELAKAQVKADEDMRLHWKAEGGVLVFDGKGRSLCTSREYSDFEMFVDWKIEPGGDSGIYLRGAPQVQIWDPAQWPEGSGGLYNNKIGPAKPLKPADNPVGSWNTFHILMQGERVSVYLNDVLVVDNVVMENYWERNKPIYPVGRIELQAHSTPLHFRNIRYREIKVH
jgi:HEAT repeat protein